ncbi:DNA phosphorothioation system sulfurtransferase DndC [Gaoshiqia sp. Z1-71]|uniref:DNA phosphorothioation system sulfurtransferase DndC n=1 Tax=Gaoshiqia hydrogeniformans TaxID=3290090 RepID=UPI003BF7CF63
MKNKRIEYIINEIVDQYTYADQTQRPWIIGFSGGKDSTALLTLVWKALLRVQALPTPFQLRRPVHVVCNDTMVENPIIAEYTSRVLERIKVAAKDQDLPIQITKTIPRLEDSFWVNTIGRGYPVPNTAFRWCTDKLKIKPTSRFITDQVVANGEAIILLGTRSSESQARAQSMKKHEIRGKRLTKHPNEANTYIYAPIRDLMIEEVWGIIHGKSPWGENNSELYSIYRDASADDYECPTMVTNKNHSSCGQSRFGCWTCTVVKQDKSMSSLVNNGFPWLKPILDLREQMINDRNILENRMNTRRNGSDAVNGMGTYTFIYRTKLLREVFEAQLEIQKSKPHIELITNQELVAIQTIWYRDLLFDKKVSDIYSSVYQNEPIMPDQNEKMIKEVNLLKEVCSDHPGNFSLIQELLILQKNKALLNRKRGLKEDMERVIEKYLQKTN